MLDVTFFPKELAGHSKMFLHLDTWALVFNKVDLPGRVCTGGATHQL